MTDITLEQWAALDSLREALPPPPRPGAHETITIGSTHLLTIHAALVELEEALRLSAGADWVLVPREPTPEMLRAGSCVEPPHSIGQNYLEREGAEQCWRIMLAAAPRHEPGE